MVAGSRDELASAFGNLVSNAVRYTPDGGTVSLGWDVDDRASGVFSVTDTGIGISADHIPRLTERFYRVDRSRSRATGGTGLGLAIVKHVLLRHQAELDVMSELGKGSTFAVILPASRIRRPLADGPDDAPPRASRNCPASPPTFLPGGSSALRAPATSSERGAEERFEIVAPDVLRRVADHPVLRLGAGRQRIEMRRVEAERRQAVGHRRRAHQLDHAPREHVARIAACPRRAFRRRGIGRRAGAARDSTAP